MEEKRILLQLPYGELSVAAIKKELTHRQVRLPYSTKMLKADLSELLRMTLEKTQTPASLIQLRAYEIDAIQHAKRDILVARLKSRGLDPYRGNRGELMTRLWRALQKEKANFEQQNKENIPPEYDRKPAAITPEQRERMEHNRKRALELQAQRAEKEKQPHITHETNGAGISVTPLRASPPITQVAQEDVEEATPVPFDYFTPIKTVQTHRVVNPYARHATQDAREEDTPEVTPVAIDHRTTIKEVKAHRVVNPYATLKRAGIASPVANLYSPVTASKTHSNSNHGPGTPALDQEERQAFRGCSRCGDTGGPHRLCIKWNHVGDIHKERNTSMWGAEHQFRWDCCGRLDGQPCFVGLHSQDEDGRTESPMVLCDCRDAASLRRTRKPTSRNRGRYFFTCSSRSCKFFRWADVALELPKEIPRVAPDGVREWELPFANPYGESMKKMMAQDRPATKRKRLLAALLLQDMCASVQGQGGMNCNGICSKELATSVLHTVEKGGDAILWKLQPLTSDQLARRFGWPSTSLVGLHQHECEKILLDLLENSQWVRSIGIRYQQGPSGEASVFVDLAGLEGYINN